MEIQEDSSSSDTTDEKDTPVYQPTSGSSEESDERYKSIIICNSLIFVKYKIQMQKPKHSVYQCN